MIARLEEPPYREKHPLNRSAVRADENYRGFCLCGNSEFLRVEQSVWHIHPTLTGSEHSESPSEPPARGPVSRVDRSAQMLLGRAVSPARWPGSVPASVCAGLFEAEVNCQAKWPVAVRGDR